MDKTLYAHYDCPNKDLAVRSTLASENRPLSISTADVRIFLLRVNMRKSAGPSMIHSHLLKAFAVQLADTNAETFNTALSQKTAKLAVKQSLKSLQFLV